MDRTGLDRPAAIRRALRTVVAERGFHGASMAAIAGEAGVATGTAYVHYGSKDDLVLAAYLEAKTDLGLAAIEAIDDPDDLRTRFVQLWLGAHDHLATRPADARFLLQVDASPYRERARGELALHGDPLTEDVTTSGMRARFVDLPDEVLHDLGLGPAVRLAATGSLPRRDLPAVAGACWAAVTTR